MEALILDTDFIAVDMMDVFESFIWTDRYSKFGDFEIHTPVSVDALTNLQQDYYLWLEDSEHVMIIEGRQIDTDPEKGNYLTITGRSLESILDRRIVWSQTILTGNLQNGIQQLLNENVISPTDIKRKIYNFIFEASVDPRITVLTIEAQYLGDNLYDVIQKLCETNGIGFRITLNNDNLFVFSLYIGEDRSYDQLQNPYVVFSPNFENLINSNYIESKKPLKTVSLVAGEGEGVDRKTAIADISSGELTDLSRRELFTDANDISSNVDGGTLTTEEYTAQLTQRGITDLSDKISVKSFEGQAETTNMFKYGEDFFMGDIVQIANEYGMETKSRVVEVVRSDGPSGIDVCPTFSTV